MYRVQGIKSLNFGDNYNILGKTGIIDASKINLNDPEQIVWFIPDNDNSPIPKHYCCQIKHFEILGKDDN